MYDECSRKKATYQSQIRLYRVCCDNNWNFFLYLSCPCPSLLSLTQVGVTPPPSTAGIITPSNALLPTAKMEILSMMKTVIEKCSQQVIQLVQFQLRMYTCKV